MVLREEVGLSDWVSKFTGQRVICIGDFMLDVFKIGQSTRMSPEAPVPVVDIKETIVSPGGAANVINNIHSLGGIPHAVGIVGDDPPGRELHDIFSRKGIKGCISFDPLHATTVKTRIIANGKQVVRYDTEKFYSDGDLVERLFKAQVEALTGKNQAKAVVISDYCKGVVSNDLIEAVLGYCLDKDIKCVVDTKRSDPSIFAGAFIITPNESETEKMSGIKIVDECSLLRAGRVILNSGISNVLITRGQNGMTLFGSDLGPIHINTTARRVFDVTGAGDTVVAALALGLAAGMDVLEACILANRAAGIVVGEVGTVAVTQSQLVKELNG